jgi:predicted dehydrogenase
MGVGHHSRRIYIPSLVNGMVDNICGLDLLQEKEVIDNYIIKNNYSIRMYYLDGDKNIDKLKKDSLKMLDNIVKDNNIDCVIISTDPLTHYKYAKWALEKGLHILMDKPITSEKNISSSLKKAKKLISDYDKLARIYQKAKNKKHIIFSLMSQRRYHPLYKIMKENVVEVFNETNCPITSIQTFHSDGQWRTPNEIIDLGYHGYNLGYGKCSHSGYHSMDIINWLVSSTESISKKITGVEVSTSFLKPSDFLHQINYSDYSKIFPDFNKINKYSEKDFLNRTKKFGEIDAFSNITFMSGKNVQTLASMNLIHNGFSQRGWFSSLDKDLYKGNGRVRQEQYIVEQGPFQSLSLIAYQSQQICEKSEDLFSMGKEFHIELHVFRNSNLFNHWKTHEVFNMRDYSEMKLSGKSRGHQEDARYAGVMDFIEAIKNNRDTLSDFLEHKRGTILLSAIYQSAIKRSSSKNALIKIDF